MFVHRTARIAGIIAHRFFDGLAYSISALFRCDGNSLDHMIGRFLRQTFEDLGPTFIKVGQVLSNRPDLLSPGVIDQLKILQRNVRPLPFETVRHVVEENLDRPMEEIFPFFEMTPVSSASVGQVHRARLRDGTEVAVKVRRPGLAEVVAADIVVFKTFGKVVKYLPGMRPLPIDAVIDAVGGAISAQLDFLREAANAKRFQNNFKDQMDVIFPRVLDSYCGQGLLVIEFMEGLVTVEDLPSSYIDTERAVTRALHALFKMIFVDGFVHGDLHPGNLFFQLGEKVVMLDLGLVVELDFEDRMDFAKFFAGMVTNNGDLCAYIVLKTAEPPLDGFDRDRFIEEMKLLVSKYAGRTTENYEVVAFVAGLFELQRRMRLTGTTKFMTTIVSLLVFEGIAKQLVPNLDFQGEAKRALLDVIIR